MIHTYEHEVESRAEERRAREARRTWIELYGPLVAGQLEPDQRYALVRVGAAEFAFSKYDAYVRAMAQVWAAGLVPEPLPSTRGIDLPDRALNLLAVDPDLADLRPADVEPPRPRFE